MNITELLKQRYSEVVENDEFWSGLEGLDYETQKWGGNCTPTIRLDGISGYIQKKESGPTVWYNVVTWERGASIGDRDMIFSRHFYAGYVVGEEWDNKVKLLEAIFQCTA